MFVLGQGLGVTSASPAQPGRNHPRRRPDKLPKNSVCILLPLARSDTRRRRRWPHTTPTHATAGGLFRHTRRTSPPPHSTASQISFRIASPPSFGARFVLSLSRAPVLRATCHFTSCVCAVRSAAQYPSLFLLFSHSLRKAHTAASAHTRCRRKRTLFLHTHAHILGSDHRFKNLCPFDGRAAIRRYHDPRRNSITSEGR